MRKNSLEQRLYSESNLYLAAYLAPSYIFNTELLSHDDRRTLNALKDAFNEQVYSEIINSVKGRLINIMDNPDDYFDVEVYFKPKSLKKSKGNDSDNSIVFRPLHTASLVDQIAMVAMLQLLVYDVQDDNTLIPSELSRLLPDNFYGNRIAYDGRHLFKPWKEQYHTYTSKEDESSNFYRNNRQYRFVVKLDIESFFPSINPGLVYKLLTEKMPMHYNQTTYQTILRKLLIFKLSSPLEGEECKWYCENIDHCTYAKGIPQGLPHSYFFANIVMVQIQKIYQSELPGDMLFYVDDSVIFTNAIKEYTDLEEKIERINAKLRTLSYNNDPYFDLPEWCKRDDFFVISIHDISDQKTSCLDLIKDSVPPDKLYLHGICRETSGISFDIQSIASEEDARIVLNRIKKILEAINREIKRISKGKNAQSGEDELYSNLLMANVDSYLKKLIQYHKFFDNRKLLLSCISESRFDLIRKQFLQVVNRICQEKTMTVQAMEEYTQNDIVTLLKLVYRHDVQYTSEEIYKINQMFDSLMNLIYGSNVQHAYLKMIKEYGQEISRYPEDNPTYASLILAAKKKYPMHKQTPVSVRMDKLKRIICTEGKKSEKELDEKTWLKGLYYNLNLSQTYLWNIIVRSMNDIPARQMLNAVASVILGYKTEDSVQFSNQKYEAMQYAELRVLAWLRSRYFSLPSFLLWSKTLCSEEYMVDADYSILKVLRYFKQYVIEPKRVDNLICVHKLCCDTWKNGSKYLYFYTLHNQEHAVQLIETIVQLCLAFMQLEIKRIDYYLLFAACYLHDISMVSMPDFSHFYADANNMKAGEIYTRYIARIKGKDSSDGKRQMVELYREMEGYFEQQIRGNHPTDSAKAIRTWMELDFLDPTDREMIARISEAHGFDSEDVYRTKAKAEEELVSMKTDCILLRLADVLDICKYRVSMLLLDHNIENMNPVSRFHWLSHLLTGRVSIVSNYTLSNKHTNRKIAYLQNGMITQKVDICIDLLLNQQTPSCKKGKCMAEIGTVSNNGEIRLICGGTKSCTQELCPFICKWFFTKNNYLLPEINEFADYLKRLPYQFYNTQVSIVLRAIQPNRLSNKQFCYVVDYVDNQE